MQILPRFPAAMSMSDTIRIALIDQFKEPTFTELAEGLFSDRAHRQFVDAQLSPREVEDQKALREALPKQERVRIGAFDGDALIGWTTGWSNPADRST